MKPKKNARRVTVVLDHDHDKKLRLIQSKMIQSTNKSVSFSRVLNEVLKKALK